MSYYNYARLCPQTKVECHTTVYLYQIEFRKFWSSPHDGEIVEKLNVILQYIYTRLNLENFGLAHMMVKLCAFP